MNLSVAGNVNTIEWLTLYKSDTNTLPCDKYALITLLTVAAPAGNHDARYACAPAVVGNNTEFTFVVNGAVGVMLADTIVKSSRTANAPTMSEHPGRALLPSIAATVIVPCSVTGSVKFTCTPEKRTH